MNLINQDFFLLASTENDLQFMRDRLVRANPTFESRITGEFDCIKALKAMNSPGFLVKFINLNDDSNCITKNIYDLIIHKSFDKDIKVILEDTFPSDIHAQKKTIFNHNTRQIRVRKKDFENINFIRKIVSTLLEIPPIYISYGYEKEKTEVIVKAIIEKSNVTLPHIKFKYDRRDVGFRKSIKEYVGKLATGKNIILIINKKYLLSEYCMEEFLGILDESQSMSELKSKIYPIVLESANCIYNPVKLVEIEEHWKKERDEVLDAMKRANNPALDEKLAFLNRIIAIIPRFAEIIRDFYNLPLEVHLENNFLDLLWEINTQLENSGYMNFYDNIDEMRRVLEEHKSIK
jgi:hypothetical protein